jgi:hypothetical protein
MGSRGFSWSVSGRALLQLAALFLVATVCGGDRISTSDNNDKEIDL